MCLYPKLIKNRKYIANEKNGGNIPAVTDKRVLMVPVGCGKCMECLKQKSREWKVRLSEEIRHNKDGKFITFSFSDYSYITLGKEIKGLTGYEKDNEIAKIAVRRFLEKWRQKNKKSVKHWFITELGKKNTERIHLHGLIFTEKDNEYIKNVWSYGNVYIGDYVNEKTINYIAKYLTKTDPIHKEYKPKILTSAGIGKGYTDRYDAETNKYNGKETKEVYRNRQGIKMALPIYYRNKIYSEEEKEKLWLQKLDKQERWINGIRVDISNGEEQYYKLLEVEREKNKRLGYGDDSINWERKRYENERHNLIKLQKIYKKSST